jgi:hypothetical protein
MTETSLWSEDLLIAVNTESARLANKQQALDAPLGHKSELVHFVEQAFSQVFKKVLHLNVTSFTQEDKEKAVILVEELDPPPELASLVDSYVDLCDMWPDVLGFDYGGSAADFLEFRSEFMPLFLERLSEFAAASDQRTLAGGTSKALKRYSKAVDSAISLDL